MRERILRTSLALALVVGIGVSIPAHAQVTQEILVVQPGANTVVMPVKRVSGGQHVLFRVINPTCNQMTFSIPELGINYPVRGLSEKTFFVDMANAPELREITYNLGVPGGNRIATGTIVNLDAWAPVSVSTASLENIINYNTAYSAPIKPEPQYRERPVSHPVRGYW